MKALHYINSLFYGFTIIPYLTIYYFAYGMYAQFLLGILQMVIALILLLYIKKFNLKVKRHFKNYWISTLGTLLILFLFSQTEKTINEALVIVFVFIIPIFIASYFIYITYLIQKK